MSYERTRQLADLIARKLKCLSEIRLLARRQAAFIGRGEMTQLLKLLSLKQELLDRLRDVEARLATYHDEDPRARVWESEEQRQRCAHMEALCQGLFQEIVHEEERGEQDMQARKSKMASQLKEVRTASETRGAYQSATTGGHRGLDLTS